MRLKALDVLDGEGAVRVHGGGFGGTIQAFVPVRRLSEFRAEIDQRLGEKSCYVMRIRKYGGGRIDLNI